MLESSRRCHPPNAISRLIDLVLMLSEDEQLDLLDELEAKHLEDRHQAEQSPLQATRLM